MVGIEDVEGLVEFVVEVEDEEIFVEVEIELVDLNV